MPVRYGINQNRDVARLAELKSQLEREWRNPTEGTSGPLIIMDTSPLQRERIYVIWDEWRDVHMEDRAETILAAYREIVNDEQKALRVAMVLGLTSEEAPNFGIQPERYLHA